MGEENSQVMFYRSIYDILVPTYIGIIYVYLMLKVYIFTTF